MIACRVDKRLSELVGGSYGEFWNDKSRYRVLKGGKGSKKSTTCALNFITRLMKYPDSNLLVVRQVMDTHRSSTFAQLNWAIKRLGVESLWRATVSPMELCYIPTGQKVLFRGFDDPLKLASTTVPQGSLCWVWVEEAYEIEREDDFDKLDLSVPRGGVSPPLFKQTTVTFNPWSEHHWLKKRFFDRESEAVSTYTTTYMDNEFLDETDRAIFKRMRRDNPRRYAVAGLGQWGVSEGLVYDRWRVEPFDLARIEDGCEWRFRHVFGLDYGYTNDPTAFIAAAVDPINHAAYIYDEHYERRMLNSDIAKMLADKGYRKERIRADCAEPKSNDDLRRMGISRVVASEKGRDSVLNGIARIQEYELIVHSSCVHTAAELGSYRFKKLRDGSVDRYPVDSDNHLMDALRYAFEDIRGFNPAPPMKRRSDGGSIITSSDLVGGWG